MASPWSSKAISPETPVRSESTTFVSSPLRTERISVTARDASVTPVTKSAGTSSCSFPCVTLPCWFSSAIVTDSRAPGEPKDPDSTSLTVIFDAFATPEERENFRAELRSGLGWGEAKKRLADQLDREIGPMRARYEELMAHPAQVEEILQEGARKARLIATPFMAELRHAVGLRSFTEIAAPQTAKKKAQKVQRATFKQYREKDGRFYFKLISAAGDELLLSEGFESGRDAGQWVGRLKKEGAAALEGAPVSFLEGITRDAVEAALLSFSEEE